MVLPAPTGAPRRNCRFGFNAASGRSARFIVCFQCRTTGAPVMCEWRTVEAAGGLSAFQSGIECRSSRSNRSSGRGRRPAAWTGRRGESATPSGGRKMPEALVPERSIASRRIPEIPRPALSHQKLGSRGGIVQQAIAFGNEANGLQSCKERHEFVFGNASRLGQRRRCINPARDMSKQVEIERGKQSLRRHEP